MDAFHIQGSRILSRSFTIPLSRSDPSSSRRPVSQDEKDDEERDEEEEEEEEVAVMVPMADMLNAAYERDNARLFGDNDDDAGEEEGEVLDRLGEGYTMISTKPIKQGEQIVSESDSQDSSFLNQETLIERAVQHLCLSTQFRAAEKVRSRRYVPFARKLVVASTSG